MGTCCKRVKINPETIKEDKEKQVKTNAGEDSKAVSRVRMRNKKNNQNQNSIRVPSKLEMKKSKILAKRTLETVTKSSLDQSI